MLNQKSDKKNTNILLSLFLLTQAAIPLDNLINFGAAFSQFAVSITPDLTYLFGLAYWLEAPLMLLYVRSMIYKDYKFKAINILYFMPFILFTIYHSVTWIMLDDSIQRTILAVDKIDNAYWLDRLLYFIRQNFRVILSFVALYELMRYQDLIKNEVSNTLDIDLNWLKVLVIGFLLIRLNSLVISILIIFNFDLDLNWVDHEAVGLTSNFIIMLLVSSLIYFALSKPNFFKGIIIDRSPSSKKENCVELKEIISSDKIKHIVSYLETNKPFLHPLLTLESLAKQLDMSPRLLSNVLNKHFEKNFYEFINSYRIEESKRLIKENIDKKFTMLEILNESGFNSKATFNTFFKKQVDMTPREFKKHCQNQISG
ncbi:helix-turn-helix domain-containing protein [Pseudocolwellia sp. HL-MZ19]|uniref:helix-turn-helix domain-containing protein n=1 Tax=unclassified Pseudocolwellia TaxID=2848178 RepID=UPI003CE9518C